MGLEGALFRAYFPASRPASASPPSAAAPGAATASDVEAVSPSAERHATW